MSQHHHTFYRFWTGRRFCCFNPGANFQHYLSAVVSPVQLSGHLLQSFLSSAVIPVAPVCFEWQRGICIADVDECEDGTHMCRYSQVCENTIGGYRCSCPRGYRSQGVGRPCLGELRFFPCSLLVLLLKTNLCAVSY